MPTLTTGALLRMMAMAAGLSVVGHIALGMKVLSVTAFITATALFYCIIFAWTVRCRNAK